MLKQGDSTVGNGDIAVAIIKAITLTGGTSEYAISKGTCMFVVKMKVADA